MQMNSEISIGKLEKSGHGETFSIVANLSVKVLAIGEELRKAAVGYWFACFPNEG